MKKNLILLAISIAAFASCSKEAAVVDEQMPDQVGHDGIVATKTITFTATVEQGEPDSKATISSASNFTWQTTDKVAVLTAKGKKVTLSPSGTIDKGSANFTATIDEDDNIDDGAIVVFPASLMDDSGNIVFPTSYAKLSDAVGPCLAAEVQAGRSTLAFKYFAGALKININDLPRYITSIAINTRTSDNNGTVVCTGTYSIAFDEGLPVLTGGTSTGNVITVNNGANVYGSQSFVLPIPTASAQKIWFDFKINSTSYRAVSATKTFARNSFISMAGLTLVEGVYFKSEDGNNWGENTTGAMTAGSNFQYTAPDKTFYPANATDQFDFKYYVKIGSNYVKFGPNSSVAVGTSGATYNWGIQDSNSAHLNVPGVYSFTYTSTTGQFKVERSSLQLYLTGADGDWDFDLDRPLTKAGHYQYKLGIKDDYKLFYGPSWAESLGKNGTEDNGKAYPVINGSTNFGSDDAYASIIIDEDTGKYYSWSDGTNNTSSFSKLYIKGSWDGFSTGVAMTRSAGNNHIWTVSHTFTANQTFKVTDGDKAWWGYDNNMGVIYDNVVDPDDGTASNLKVTVAGTYLIIFNDATNKYNIIKTS